MRSNPTHRVSVMTELTRAEALALLCEERVGRVVFTRAALPDVRPVNFAVHGDAVVFLVDKDSSLARALDGNVVAFEADRVDESDETGWSVVVTGRAEVSPVDDAADRLTAGLRRPWAPGDYGLLVRLSAEIVTGRRIARVTGDSSG